MAFVTVLIPHEADSDIGRFLQLVKMPDLSHYPETIGVEIGDADESVTLGMKLNLGSEILRENVRPRYCWESGKAKYGEIETDARFVYCKKRGSQLSYAFTEAVRLNYRDQEVFAAKPCAFPLQYTGEETKVGVPKWRAWEGTAEIGS